jgi:predicted NBD/HSP70 family sugar kinase
MQMSLRGTNQEYGRPYNRRIVLEAIRRDGASTRGRIADAVGLTVQTVSTIIRELEDLGLILASKVEPKGRGLPPTTLSINPEGGHAIGLCVTPLGVDAGLLNLAGDVIATRHRPQRQVTADEGFRLIAELVPELVALRPGGRMLGVGLAMPGPFDVESMSFVGPTTMAGWGNVPIKERLTEVTKLPAFMATDMSAAALGERLYGRGAEFGDFYYLYFGVGLGGAMMHDGQVYRGAWGNAGEIGHIPVVPDGEPCPCGNRGCLERYVSLDAFARNGHGDAPIGWARRVAPQFRAAITVIENLFDPETIILGGVADQELLDALGAMTGELASSVSARRDRKVPRVLVSDAGPQSVLRGAAALAVAGVLSPRFGQLLAPERAERDPLNHRGLAA